MHRWLHRFLLVLVAALALAAPAAAADDSHALLAKEHGPAAEQPLADRTAQWLSGLLGVEVPRQRVGVLDTHAYPGWSAASFPVYGSAERVIRARPRYTGEWGRGRVSLDGATLLIHELLHGVSMDEGAVEALALDLTPAWMARFGQRNRYAGSYVANPQSNSAYPDLVRDVRGRSAVETGRPWWHREARLWRRAYLVENAIGGGV